MQVWKRRVVALVSAGVGGAGLLVPSVGAQTTPPPTSVPTFTIPEFPDFPDFTIPSIPPPPTMPPPTKPPPTSSSSIPPPTMPPPTSSTSIPPPTMPPTTITIPAGTEDLIEDAISRLEQFGDEFSGIVNDLRAILDLF